MEQTSKWEEHIRHLREDYTETEKVILSRRSVRWYRGEQVPEFMISRILEAGRFAPSAGNCQPWKFVVIRDEKVIDELSNRVVAICRFLKAFLDYRAPGSFWKYPIAWLFISLMPKKLHPMPFSVITLIAEGKLKLFHGAPTVILILKDKRGISNPDLDCGMAGQNMVLAANSMGLATCWVSFAQAAFDFFGSKWRKAFGIRYPYEFVAGIAVGRPMGKPNGFVDRSTHPVTWVENGKTEMRDADAAPSGIGLAERFGIPDYRDPARTRGGELSFDHEKCTGCGTCARICPMSSIAMVDKRPFMPAGGSCFACGDCLAICPNRAIRLKSGYRLSERFKTIDHGALSPPRMR